MSKGKYSEKNIGLWGVVFTIIGFVVGVSIFILPAELIGIAGPAVLLSYTIAGLMAIITCFATTQIGTLIPTDGGSYVAISRLLSPFMGFLAVWVILASIILVNAFIGYGFADYFVYFVPGTNKTLLAVCVILFFGLVNIIGSDAVVKFQSVMVIFFLIMLSTFIISGIPFFESKNLTPFMPNGFDSVILAATIGYFSFAGFISVLEFGGQVKRPAVNIPLGLGISFVIVIFFYAGISLILSGVNVDIDYQTVTTPVLEVAKVFLPKWVIHAMVISILAAAASTVNGLILGYSRDIFVMAEAGLFPKTLAKTSKRFGTPIYAIITYTLLSVGAVLMGNSIFDYALIAVLGLLMQQAFTAAALFQIPSKMKDEYEKAELRLSNPLLYITSILLFLISISFILTNIIREPIFGLMIMGLLGVGSLYYLIIIRHTKTSQD